MMKGKLYKRSPPEEKNDIFKFFMSKEKPWRKGQWKEYIWKSSIPEKWVELKGENYFVPSSQLNRPKLSIELLQNTQKYLTDVQNYDKSRSALASPAKMKDSPKSNRRERSATIDLPYTPNNRTDSLSIIIQNHPSSVRCASAGKSKDSTMRDFLNRFDKKPCSQEHPISNKGLSGWKLKRVQTSQKRKKSLKQKIQIPDQADLIFKSICSNRIYY